MIIGGRRFEFRKGILFFFSFAACLFEYQVKRTPNDVFFAQIYFSRFHHSFLTLVIIMH